MAKRKEKPFSEYVEGVSCLHANGADNWTYCAKCGTECLRDKEGRIVQYDRGDLDLKKYG